MQLTDIVSLIRAHAWIALAWCVLTAIVNTLFGWKTPEQVEAFAEKSPFLSKLAALVRHLGVDPVAALRVIASFFAKDPSPPGAGPTATATATTSAAITLRSAALGAGGAAIVAAAAILLSGCSAAQRQTEVAIGTTIADDVCQELEQQPEPDWVILVCAAEGAVTKTIHVRIPRAQWAAIRARRLDAGPGK